MATLCIRDFPEGLYRRVCERAERNHRSVDEEIIALLESALRDDRMEALDRIARRRASVPKSSDSLELLREDRDR